MNKKPIFVDLSGNTARIDHPRTKTAYSRLMICTADVYDHELGHILTPGKTIEVWLDAEHAEALAEALKQGCKP